MTLPYGLDCERGMIMAVRVMITDDESMVRVLIRDIIETCVPGVTVVGEAEDGDECLALCVELKPQIIITDVVMPNTDGLSLLRQIKTILPDVLVILLSAHRKFEYVHEAIREQAFDYLLKPTREEDIERVFQRALEVIGERKKHKALYSEMRNRIKKYGSQIVVSTSENDNDDTYTDNMERVIRYVNNNYCQEISLQDIAGKFYIDPDYLSLCFKKKTGINFKEYLCNLRIRKAEELLMRPEFKITEIAELVGYNDSGYFIKVFKNRLGCTPRQYREQRKSNIKKL